MESSKSKEIPAFFKPLVEEDGEQRLLIPQFFSKFMKGRMPYVAFIRDSKQKLWVVNLSQRENQYFFEAGWSKFVQEKNVQLGDFLMFEYDGKSYFDVKIFGRTSCEKGFDVEVFEAQVKEEEMEEEEDEEGEDKEMEEEVESDKKGYTDGDQDKIVELRDVIKGKQSNHLADEKIFDLGLVDRPKNPYFVGKLDPKRKGYLRVPADVIRDFNLKLQESIDLCDEDGRTWFAVVKEWNDGRTFLTKGWRAFCKWNAVKPDDKCLCEFVPGPDGSKMQLRVRIFRAASLLQ